MCGITGFLSQNEIPAKLLERMTSKISHRGPDAQGFFFDEDKKIGLGHRRLSILDLSVSGNQPMSSPCGNYTIVFNGEVYNYPELKNQFLNGVALQSSSDTEVVLQCFIKEGPSFVQHLNGMFAFAIYDSLKATTYIYLDRIGIKPIYYFQDNNKFLFASELKSIAAISQELGKFELDLKATQQYLRLGYIPAPLTIYKEVKKFPNGHYAEVKNGKASFVKYWDLESQITPVTLKDEKQAIHQLQDLLISSVDYRLRSDVPYGVFLSGGIDSSTVAAIAQSRSPQRINTFSIGFKESKFNESTYAKAVSKALNTEHHEYTLSYHDAIALVPEITKIYDEPYADASAIPTFLVSKIARQEVKMVLTGDGGDEQFLGYGMYNWAERLNKPLLNYLKKPIKTALQSTNKSRFKRVAELFDFDTSADLMAHIFSAEQYFFTEKGLNDVYQYEKVKMELQLDKINRKLSAKEKQALFDLKYYLKDDLLTKVDRASMANSLEARVPLLDHRIVSFSLNLDESLKIRNGANKYLLKQVLYNYLPPGIFDRPKWGFGIPLSTWMKNELKQMLENTVSHEKLDELVFLNTPYILNLKKKYLEGESHLYNKLWLILVLVQWYEQHKNHLKNG
ncbi:MAG: asparagine synthase (glutamine-hydrolyzing) [Crocinitomicaceae bacterium]|nr:asparagine synthase (glutamine-hydrolyzing) [Crocinitomicaceae bacterium]